MNVRREATSNGTAEPKWLRTPPINGPIAVPIPATALTQPKYFVRFSSEVISAKYANIAEISPPVSPSMSLPKNSTHNAPPNPKIK